MREGAVHTTITFEKRVGGIGGLVRASSQLDHGITEEGGWGLDDRGGGVMLVSFRVKIFCVSFVDRALDPCGGGDWGNAADAESFRCIGTKQVYFSLRRGRKFLHSLWPISGVYTPCGGSTR